MLIGMLSRATTLFSHQRTPIGLPTLCGARPALYTFSGHQMITIIFTFKIGKNRFQGFIEAYHFARVWNLDMYQSKDVTRYYVSLDRTMYCICHIYGYTMLSPLRVHLQLICGTTTR